MFYEPDRQIAPESRPLSVGTIGFAYPEWGNIFYPPSTPPSKRLAFYATQFPVVELDTTFYGIPKLAQFLTWQDHTPESFRFFLKVPQAISHQTDFGGSCERETAQALKDFCQLSREGLGAKLGGILLQFPPTFASNRRYALDRLLEAGRSFPLMVEFRHKSWWNDSVVSLLKRHQVVWVSADLAGIGEGWQVPMADPPYTPIDTGDFLYLRCCGRHGQYESDSVELGDVTPRLYWWREQIDAISNPGKPLVVTFGNSFAGHAPACCLRCLRLFERPVPKPVQASLFDEL
ncbi:MAG: DUF72 domain-containing protein [Fimbriimonadaceae bacterium]|jgi:uncharacterized protein YecE (DUF72 family)|nr:DUF72 domain-containing protein [Fimbriimonadaceae bacterium]